MHTLAISPVYFLGLRALLQLATLLWMSRRGFVRVFPFFAAYLAVEVVSALVTVTIFGLGDAYYRHYFLFYWCVFPLEVGLRIAVIREVIRGVFARYQGIRDLGSQVFRWGGVIILAGVAVFAVLMPGADSTPLVSGLLNAERIVNGVQVILLVLLFVLAMGLGLPWRNYAFGIGLGFGIYSLTAAAGFSLRLLGGKISAEMLSMGEVAGGLLAVCAWLGFLAVREPVQVTELPPDFALERWNQELIRMLQQ